MSTTSRHDRMVALVVDHNEFLRNVLAVKFQSSVPNAWVNQTPILLYYKEFC